MPKRDYTYNYSRAMAIPAQRDACRPHQFFAAPRAEEPRQVVISRDALMYAGIGALLVLGIQAVISLVAPRFRGGAREGAVVIDGRTYVPA